MILPYGGGRHLILPEAIESAVCECFGVTPGNLRSSARTRSCSEPRKVAAYLMKMHTILSYQEIGEFFGRTDHSTAHYWVQYCKKEIERGSLFMIDIVNQVNESIFKHTQEGETCGQESNEAC